MMIANNTSRSKDNIYNMIRILSRQRLGLKIVHINAQSLNSKIDEFRYIFASSKIDIICVSETWFPSDVQDSVYNLHGFSLFRADRKTKVVTNGVVKDRKGGGVAIFVRNGINCLVKLKTKENSKIEYLFLEITSRDKRKMLVGCVYRPKSDLEFISLIDIIEDFSIQYNDIVILGDFNHNILVDNTLTEKMQLIGLLPVNISTPTHYHSTSNSLIDLLFVNDKSNVLLYDQLSASVFSRHDMLFVTYDFCVTREDKHITYRDFHNIDYAILNQHIDNVEWNIVYSLVSVDDQLNFF